MLQDPAFLLNDIMQDLTNLSQILTSQGVPSLIVRSNGTRESLFQWLKSTEERAVVVCVSDNQGNCKYVAVKFLD